VWAKLYTLTSELNGGYGNIHTPTVVAPEIVMSAPGAEDWVGPRAGLDYCLPTELSRFSHRPTNTGTC
jgi:hypothetical protein